jgi:hypothetical protein
MYRLNLRLQIDLAPTMQSETQLQDKISTKLKENGIHTIGALLQLSEKSK